MSGIFGEDFKKVKDRLLEQLEVPEELLKDRGDGTTAAEEAIKQGEFNKILIPMIRRIMPSTIATDIIGVQSMDPDPKRGDRRMGVVFVLGGGKEPDIYDGEKWISVESVEGQRIIREMELK